MARIRTIKPAFFRHGGLYDAEKETGLPLRVAFAGLWTAADREGRFEWKPRELKLDCLPFDEVDFSRVLDALLTRGHIVKYTTQTGVFGFIPSWHEHQIVNNRETASSFPEPTETSIDSTSCTRDPHVEHASPTPLCNYTGEGKGRERIDDASTTRVSVKPVSKKKRELELLVEEGVDPKVAADWLRIRDAKHKPLTDTAWAGVKREALLAGMTPAEAVRHAAESGWQGFKASWLNEQKNGKGPNHPSVDIFAGAR